ncbi:MAG: hypothetical protein A2854_00850 [Parcubacteria group bacterium RIFCSPHIGHO2_01_FULL_56_18]|nr:MAG: hypothetical protein A2854_00850 [Parcubacteria group bacterium RIFCSPHIGHO2_01_FULL_56_18]
MLALAKESVTAVVEVVARAAPMEEVGTVESVTTILLTVLEVVAEEVVEELAADRELRVTR